MKKLRFIACLSFFLVLSNCTILIAQTKKYQQKTVVDFNDNLKAPLTVEERKKIEEVYGEHIYKEILNRPNRLRSIKNILRNRVVIMEIKNPFDQKPCDLLSSVPVFDFFVPELRRDAFFNKDNFNPLKYAFSFYSRKSYMYRVDNTNYFILIKSQFSI